MSVDLGFETIGNATLTVFDGGRPVLTTDPWLDGQPYFGSWNHAYEMPAAQRRNIVESSYAWISHGHPDHLCTMSLKEMANTTLLLPDHVGGRILDDLREAGFTCREVPSNQWIELSANVKIKSFADWNQDAVLVVAIGENDIVVNLNDGQAWGWSREVKRAMEGYRNRFVLALRNWGDADMINIFDEEGHFIEPRAAQKPSVGAMYTALLQQWRGTHTIPFSGFHRYQRTDAAHINPFATPMEAHFEGFDSRVGELLPAFIAWDSERGDFTRLEPAACAETLIEPEAFGDNWSDQLEADDKTAIDSYFRARTHLGKHIGTVRTIVGGQPFDVRLSDKAARVTFEVPRHSLMTAIEYEIFDDLLIGNFMKTTLSGMASLYPNFTPYVAKYGDNGRARDEAELRDYFRAYRARSTFNYVFDRTIHRSEDVVRGFIAPDTPLYRIAKPIKRLLRS